MKGTVLRRMSSKLISIATIAQQRLFLKCAYAKAEPTERKIKYNRCSGVLIAIIFGLLFGLQNPDDAKVVNSITHSNVVETSIVQAEATKKTESTSSNASDTTTINTVLQWIAGWVKILGGVVAFVGAVEVGFGFFKNDPGAKTQGWQIIVSGGIIAAAGAGWDTLITL